MNIRGRIYRAWSKLIHRFDYHYMPVLPVIDDPKTDRHWCQWCGIRGSKASKYGLKVALKELKQPKGRAK